MSGTYIAFDPGNAHGDRVVGIVVSMDKKFIMTVHDEFETKRFEKEDGMSESVVRMRKYVDEERNVYGVEKSARNGKWVVIRTNEGGNRKAAKQFAIAGNPVAVQRLLDSVAGTNGWKEVPE